MKRLISYKFRTICRRRRFEFLLKDGVLIWSWSVSILRCLISFSFPWSFDDPHFKFLLIVEEASQTDLGENVKYETNRENHENLENRGDNRPDERALRSILPEKTVQNIFARLDKIEREENEVRDRLARLSQESWKLEKAIKAEVADCWYIYKHTL